MDFMLDVLADGRRFRTLNVLDTVTRECLAIEVHTSLPGQRVVRLLEQLIHWHGTPKQITLDTGPSSPAKPSTSGPMPTASPSISSTWQTHAERLSGELQWHVPRRMLEHPLVAQPRRCSPDHRRLEAELQHPAAVLRMLGGRTPTQHAEYYQQARSLA
jgi:hypothetical protein